MSFEDSGSRLHLPGVADLRPIEISLSFGATSLSNLSLQKKIKIKFDQNSKLKNDIHLKTLLTCPVQ